MCGYVPCPSPRRPPFALQRRPGWKGCKWLRPACRQWTGLKEIDWLNFVKLLMSEWQWWPSHCPIVPRRVQPSTKIDWYMQYSLESRQVLELSCCSWCSSSLAPRKSTDDWLLFRESLFLTPLFRASSLAASLLNTGSCWVNRCYPCWGRKIIMIMLPLD